MPKAAVASEAGAPRGVFRKPGIAVAALLAFGMALRIWGAVAHPLEQDEMYTVLESRDLFATTLLPGIDARPLYYVLHHPLLEVFPEDVRWMRLLPLCFAALGLWMTWIVGRRLGGPFVGVVALALTVISPWHLYASEFARYWSLVYLVTLGFLHFVTRGYETDDRQSLLLALLCSVVGAFSHPAYVLGIVGIVVGLHLVRADGTFGLRLPSRRALLTLWLPLACIAAAWGATLVMTSTADAARNFGGRGLRGTLMLIPAIAQWAQPAILVAGFGGALVLLFSSKARALTTAGIVGAVGLLFLLFVAAWRTDAYADYAIGMLPFLHLSTAALLGQFSRTGWRDGITVAAVALALAAAVLPSTVSHVLDGTRFDHRPALAYIRDVDPSRPVMGWPEILLKEYGAGLVQLPYAHSPARLSSALAQSSSFWLVLSAREYGYPWIDDASLRWVADSCRRQSSWQRLRLDSRQYRVELYLCESGRRSTVTS